MKKILQTLLTGILLSFVGVTAFAAPSGDITIQGAVSHFTPNRPGLTYCEGALGLDYPSFNNFINNPNLSALSNKYGENCVNGRDTKFDYSSPDATADERQFTVAKLCKGGDCNGGYYYNTLLNVDEGDTVRFEVFFHNNGDDPYDFNNDGSEHAENVKIGIDYENFIVDHEGSVEVSRPAGFIYASNNKYKDSNGNIIKQSGTITRKATDDTQIVFSRTDLMFEPILNETYLYMNDYDDYVTRSGTSFDLQVGEKVDSVKIKTKSYVQDGKMWIEFEELPGCFRYSGFAYFDVKVVKKPAVCTALTVHSPTVIYPNEIVAFDGKSLGSDGDTFGGYMSYTVNSVNGRFFTSYADANDYLNRKGIEHDSVEVTKKPGENVEICSESVSNIGNDTDGYTMLNRKPGETIYFVAFKSGANLVKIDTKCTTVSGCTKYLSVTKKPEVPRACKALNVVDYLGNDVTSMNSKMVYDLKSDVEFSDGTTGTTTYTSTEGFFVELGNINLLEAKSYFNARLGTGKYTKSTVPSEYGTTITVNDGSIVLFVPFDDAVTKTNAVEIKESGYEADCYDVLSLTVDEKPETICVSLNVVDEDGITVSSFEPTDVYFLKSNVGYSDDTVGRTRYESSEGVFMDVSSFTGAITPESVRASLLVAKRHGLLDRDTYADSDYAVSDNLVVNDGDLVLYIPFNDAVDKTDAVKVSAVGYEDLCIKVMPMIVEHILTCTSLDVKLNNAHPDYMDVNSVYLVDGTSYFSDSYDGFITYTIDPRYGSLLEVSNSYSGRIYTDTLNAIANITPEMLVEERYTNNDHPDAEVEGATGALHPEAEVETNDTLNETPVVYYDGNGDRVIDEVAYDLIAYSKNGGLQKNIIPEAYRGQSTVTVRNGESVIAYIYNLESEVDLTLEDILTVKTVGFENECFDSFGLKIKGIPVEPLKCLDLDIIDPNDPWTVDEDTDSERFKINVRTNKANGENDLFYYWKLEDGKAIWKDGEEVDNDEEYVVTKGDLSNVLHEIDLDEIDDDTVVKVWATYEKGGSKIAVCSDELGIEVDVDDDSKLDKKVYSNRDNDWVNSIEITGRNANKVSWLNPNDKYITYLLSFKTDGARSAEIWDDTLHNGEVSASHGTGSLDFRSMAIAVDMKGKSKDYIIYKSDDFKISRYKNKVLPNGKKLDDFKNYDKSESYFEEEYLCSDNNLTGMCIDMDEGEIENEFKDGDHLKFENMKKVEHVYVLYEMINNTSVTPDYCVSIQSGYCGEKFKNFAKFKTRTRDWKDIDDEDDLKAEVSVLCPTFISRSGGDMFFHSELPGGIDVSACYAVKNTPIIIKPTPEDPNKNVSTGGCTPAGEDGVLGTDDDIECPSETGPLLSMPTHDVCQFSNSSNSQYEGYRNVLKNFSSSVCEMQADVAEDWKEKYINEAIKANVERLGRFGSVSGNLEVVNQNSIVSKFGIDDNGVFVIDGDLTINGGIGGYRIAGKDGLPAAQTYIVRGGDLIIKSNIKYDDTDVDVTKPTTLPSVAFIVIDGDIKIDNSVTELDGVYMAVDTEGDDDGRVMPLTDTHEYTNTLTVKGSLVGDVYELFTHRHAVGNVYKDESAITIRYDERILLNTPSGVSEIVDVSQLRVAK